MSTQTATALMARPRYHTLRRLLAALESTRTALAELAAVNHTEADADDAAAGLAGNYPGDTPRWDLLTSEAWHIRWTIDRAVGLLESESPPSLFPARVRRGKGKAEEE